MIYSVTADVPPEFNLFAMTHNLRAYLHTRHGIPEEAVEHIFFWRNRIDFSLKNGYGSEDWYLEFVGQ